MGRITTRTQGVTTPHNTSTPPNTPNSCEQRVYFQQKLCTLYQKKIYAVSMAVSFEFSMIPLCVRQETIYVVNFLTTVIIIALYGSSTSIIPISLENLFNILPESIFIYKTLLQSSIHYITFLSFQWSRFVPLYGYALFS